MRLGLAAFEILGRRAGGVGYGFLLATKRQTSEAIMTAHVWKLPSGYLGSDDCLIVISPGSLLFCRPSHRDAAVAERIEPR